MFRSIIVVTTAVMGMLIPPAVRADVLWTGDFETGDLSQWSSKLDAEPGTTDRLVVVESPTRQGRYGLKVTVKPGDLDNGGNRAEVVLRERWFYEGEEVWYHWYTLFPSDYKVTPKWALYTQWHSDNVYGVPLGFNLHGTKLSVRVMGHKYDAEQNWNGGVLWTDTLQTGKWMEFLLRVKWSDQNDGFIEMWKDGQLVIPKTFHPNMDPNTPVYLKFGFYRDKSIDYAQTIFHDGMTIYKARPAHLFEAPTPDGGTPDAGTEPDPEPDPKDQDAGTPDAGNPEPPDAGPGRDPVTPGDAGVDDRDGGVQLPDGGFDPLPPVGCSAAAAPAFGLLALLLTFAFGRRRKDGPGR